MRARVGLRLAVLGAILVALASAAASVSNAGLRPDLLGVTGLLGFTGVGAVILDRRPGEPIGRISFGIGVMFGIAAILRGVVSSVNDMEGRLPPLFAGVAVVSEATASLALLLSGPLLISRFPHRASGAWQRRTEDLLMSAVGVIVVVEALHPGVIDIGSFENVPNPLAIRGLPLDDETVFNLTFVLYGLSYLITTLGLAGRYRRGGSVVRAQIRWFAAAISVSLALFVVTVVTTGNESLNELAWSTWILSLFLPPIAIATAILRYHLYDIDRIISNTLAYGLITAVLFGVFALVNLAIQGAMRASNDDDPIGVALATLLVAGLFNPVRTRVQHAVDRRFHRARYDADRMVAEFSGRLRDELDLHTLAFELTAVTDRAVKPSIANVWLRGRARI